MSNCDEIFIVSTEIPKPRKKRGDRVQRDVKSQLKYRVPNLDISVKKEEAKEEPK
jgi:hypothetical protein